jgi:hypothetical protein
MTTAPVVPFRSFWYWRARANQIGRVGRRNEPRRDRTSSAELNLRGAQKAAAQCRDINVQPRIGF